MAVPITPTFEFLSTLSLRRATTRSQPSRPKILISIHALLAESDRGISSKTAEIANFYPRSPCGERPWPPATMGWTTWHFYPRSPCGERPLPKSILHSSQLISIHALLAESDQEKNNGHETAPYISIHALLAESDGYTVNFHAKPGNFYPRSPCGERHSKCRCRPAYTQISIHALLAESDSRRRTYQQGEKISIHALLAESDKTVTPMVTPPSYISIHALLAESDQPRKTEVPGAIEISIHALLAESDLAGMSDKLIGTVFLSTLSLRRATKLAEAINPS